MLPWFKGSPATLPPAFLIWLGLAGSWGCSQGPALSLTVNLPQESSLRPIGQVRLRGAVEGELLFDEVRPSPKKGPLPSSQKVRILLPESSRGLKLGLIVEGLSLVTDVPIARGEMEIRLSSEETPWTLDLKPLPFTPTTLAAGQYHSCARTLEGGLGCWGNNDGGQLGNGCSPGSPATIPGFAVATASAPTDMQVATGRSHSCAIRPSTRELSCWGSNILGALGSPGGEMRCGPFPVEAPRLDGGWKSVTAGLDHTCGLSFSNEAYCWGSNAHGQLGLGGASGTSVPTRLPLHDVAMISAGGNHTCALGQNGSVVCWGENSRTQNLPDGGAYFAGVTGQIAGNCGPDSGADVPGPQYVPGLGAGVKAIALGWFHSCALMTTGAIKCWGWNYFGQLGRPAPTDGGSICGVETVTVLDAGADLLVAGGFHTCARLADSGGVRCWGTNDVGALGEPADASVESTTSAVAKK